MKNLMAILAAAMSFCTIACAQSSNRNTEDMDKKTIVVYFSATGTTRNVAKEIAAANGAELMEIKPAQPYSDADLNWNDKQSRSSVEMHNLKFRPAIEPSDKDMTGYDVIFIGYPIWWDLAPTVVNTFIESNDLKGKTIIPFATSGGSSIRNSVATLKKQYPEINWADGKLINNPSTKIISRWISEESAINQMGGK